MTEYSMSSSNSVQVIQTMMYFIGVVFEIKPPTSIVNAINHNLKV